MKEAEIKKLNVISTEEELFQEILKNHPDIITDEKGFISDEAMKKVAEVIKNNNK